MTLAESFGKSKIACFLSSATFRPTREIWSHVKILENGTNNFRVKFQFESQFEVLTLSLKHAKALVILSWHSRNLHTCCSLLQKLTISSPAMGTGSQRHNHALWVTRLSNVVQVFWQEPQADTPVQINALVCIRKARQVRSLVPGLYMLPQSLVLANSGTPFLCDHLVVFFFNQERKTAKPAAHCQHQLSDLGKNFRQSWAFCQSSESQDSSD